MSVSPTHKQQVLNAIFQKLQGPKPLSELLATIEPDMLAFLHAERITIYQKGQAGREILSRYHSADHQVLEIRLPLSPSSIAGYVAMSQRSLRIDDVYDAPTLQAIHPALQFDRRFDAQSGFRSKSMMVIPIKFGAILLGLLQVINRQDGASFNDQDMNHCQELARIIAHKLRNESQPTRGPYDLLLQEGRLTPPQWEELRTRTGGDDGKLEKELQSLGIATPDLGRSLERYFQCPFVGYTPSWHPPDALWRDLNPAYLKRQLWAPVAGDRHKAVIAIHDPSDVKRIMEMQGTLKADSYELRVSLQTDILQFIEAATDPSPPRSTPAPVEANAGEDFIITLVSRLISTLIRANAQELTIRVQPDNQNGLAAIRNGDAWRTVAAIPREQLTGVLNHIRSMGQWETDQQGQFTVRAGGKVQEMVVLPEPAGEGLSIRWHKK